MKTTDNPQYSEYETENMQESTTLERKKKEKNLAKERKGKKKVNKRKRDGEEYCADHHPPLMADDEVLSNDSPCDCPAHVHDRESPLKNCRGEIWQKICDLHRVSDFSVELW